MPLVGTHAHILYGSIYDLGLACSRSACTFTILSAANHLLRSYGVSVSPAAISASISSLSVFKDMP